MDPNTQKLIEKTRQRREMLNQRIAGMPEAAPRKRRTPVHEQETDHVLAEKQLNQDDSPKRQCKRDEELEQKSPGVLGNQSWNRELSQSDRRENEENVERTPTPTPRKSISSPPLSRKADVAMTRSSPLKEVASSSARKGRFAALANHISSWEDDLTHHVIPKEEPKKPKWQPPSKSDNQSSTFGLTVPSGKGPAPHPPHESVSSPTKLAILSASSGVSSPTKLASLSASSGVSSPTKLASLSASSGNTKKTTNATAVGNTFKKTTEIPQKIPSYLANGTMPKKTSSDVALSCSPKKTLGDTVGSTTPKKNSNDAVLKSTTPKKSSSDTMLCSTSPRKTTNDSMDIGPSKPTFPPVSEDVAATTTSPASTLIRNSTIRSSKVELNRSPKPFSSPYGSNMPTPSKSATETTRITSPRAQVSPVKAVSDSAVSTLGFNVASGVSRQSAIVCDDTKTRKEPEKRTKTDLNTTADEPTLRPVSQRLATWAKRIEEAGNCQPVEPSRQPLSAKLDLFEKKIVENTPKKKIVNAPFISKTPSKVSPGTKMTQQILIERVQDSGTTGSSMAAQSRASRLAELQVIQNRWKDGVLREDGSSGESAPEPEAVVKPLPKTDQETKAPVSSKREEIRNKIRADINQKLAVIGLGQTTTTSTPVAALVPNPPVLNQPVPNPPVPNPPKPPALYDCPVQSNRVHVQSNTIMGVPVKTRASPAAGSRDGSNQTSSIYNLIKNREQTPSHSTDNKKVKFDDSFDDTDDDSQRKIPLSAIRRQAEQNSENQEFKTPHVPVLKESESDVMSSSDTGDEMFVPGNKMFMDIDDDDISLKGFVSEAVRRESILPPAQAAGSSQSSLESCDNLVQDSEGSVGSSSKQGGYHPDDESATEDDRRAVDDLLDEAFETSDDDDPDMDQNKVVLRRKPQQDPEYDPDMDVNNVVLRRKVNTAPVPAQRRTHFQVTESSDDDNNDRPYSLESYRKSANIHQHMIEPVVRKSQYSGLRIEEDEVAMPAAQPPHRDDKRAVLERIRELQELVQQEQNVIMQTSNALNKCCVGNSYFAGSTEQVECNRVLLLACQKRQCYMTEIQRLKETGNLSHDGPGPQGSLTITDIRLPLKKDFVTKIGTSQDTTTHYFIILIRNGPQLISTQMLSTHDPMMRGTLDFPNLIRINGITANFKLTLDIYCMSVSRELSLKDKKKKTPKKGKGYALALESPGGPMAVRTTSFSQVTSLQLTMKCLDKNSFHLDRLPHLSPLYGQIFMRLQCSMEVSVEERGFLTMFEDVSGFGAWHRRWCVLTGNKICVWKYPDDETRKDPMTIIDLKRCITEKVGLVPRDVCARPNTFELTTVRQPLKGEHDTLTTRTYNSTTTVRYQMSADSKEERIVWCNKINRTLANLRTWNADALKPAKQTTSSAHR